MQAIAVRDSPLNAQFRPWHPLKSSPQKHHDNGQERLDASLGRNYTFGVQAVRDAFGTGADALNSSKH